MWTVTAIIPSDNYWSPPRTEREKNSQYKLYGVGFGLNHHNNSWRITWIPDWNRINHFKVCAYVYDKSVKEHTTKYIKTVKGDEPFDIFVESVNEKYIFSDVSNIVEIPNKSKDSKLQIDLYPHTGSDMKAIKDLVFFVEFKAL